jgi:hypothetical protein
MSESLWLPMQGVGLREFLTRTFTGEPHSRRTGAHIVSQAAHTRPNR